MTELRSSTLLRAWLAGLANFDYDICIGNGGGCTPYTSSDHVVKYDDTYFTGLGGSVFAYTDSGTASWQHVAQWAMVNMGPASNPSYDCTQDPFFLNASCTADDNSSGTCSVGGGAYDGNYSQCSQHSGVWTGSGSSCTPGDGTIHSTVVDGRNVCSTKTFNNPQEVVNYIYGQGWVQDPVTHWDALTHIQANATNAFVYDDPKAAVGLLNTAFGPMLDGLHTLTTSTNLNALQEFGLVYMFLSARNNQQYVDGLLPDAGGHPQNQFLIVSPAMNGGGSNPNDDINTLIGNSFSTYHH